MPRPRQSTGRPGTAVIPSGWAPAHSRVIDNATTTASTVTIGTPGGASAWNEGLGRTVTAPANPVYQGGAQLMAVSDTARIQLVVEDPTSARVYEVTLPYAAPKTITVDMVITVDAVDPDPTLAGRTLQVAHIERGSRRFSRVLLATLLD
jgi:hypothetical protein